MPKKAVAKTEIVEVELELPPPVSARTVAENYPQMSVSSYRPDKHAKWLPISATVIAGCIAVLTAVTLVVLLVGG